MAENSEEDLERIASRLAMVVSEDGEAANAGRAVGQLARRLGLTGGDLKQIFLAGAAANEQGARLTQRTGEVERLEREVNALRASLRMIEQNSRVIERERDALHYEIAALRTTLDYRRSGSRLRQVLVTTVVIAAVLAALIGFLQPSTRVAELPQSRFEVVGSPKGALPPVGSQGTGRLAVVHAARAAVFGSPDRAAPVVATLRAGMPIVIHRLLWNMLVQWAEIDVGSGTGYVLTTDIDLS